MFVRHDYGDDLLLSDQRERGGAIRNAFSTMEVTVALLLLTACAMGVGRFVSQVQVGLRERELSRCLGWEIENAKETILSWQPSQVSVARIESLPVSEAALQRLAAAGWQAEGWRADVTSIEQPVNALQVTLRLVCRLESQPAVPKKMTFWIADSNLAESGGKQDGSSEVNAANRDQEAGNED